jgi:hypothetical protein
MLDKYIEGFFYVLLAYQNEFFFPSFPSCLLNFVLSKGETLTKTVPYLSQL